MLPIFDPSYRLDCVLDTALRLVGRMGPLFQRAGQTMGLTT